MDTADRTARRHPVVVGVGSRRSSWLALTWAIEDATRRHRPLHVIHVDGSVDCARPAGVDAHDEASAQAVLATALSRAHELAPGIEVTTEVCDQTPARALIEASTSASSVVVGARGRRALVGALLGSTSGEVAVQAACPVVVVRRPVEIRQVRPSVVVGVDGSGLSSAAIGYAFAQAAARGVPLTVVHTCSSHAHGDYVPPWRSADPAAGVARERAATAEEVAEWCEEFPDVRVRRHVLRGDPVNALVDHSRGAELLVVGSRGFGGLSGRLVGSVSQSVLDRAHCPVAVVRSEGPT